VIKMERKKHNKLVFDSLCALVIIEGLIIVGMLVYGIVNPNQSIEETDYIWVDFDVTGTIRVEVLDTNEGEVPDEAREAARRVMGEFGDYASVKIETRDYGTYGEVIVP